jgi:hypothetical protein
MSVLREILAWSGTTPPHWVRDALRRIVTQHELRDGDLQDLVALCKKAHGLADGGPDPAALSQEHVRESEPTGAVSLCALTHVSDVNALEPGQTIAFAAQGLTVVYGDNGAGKSGYARILKRACRARGSADPVLPNALSDRPAGTPTARLRVLVNETESEHGWVDGTTCAPVLSAVSVFDTAAAQVYVTDKTDVRFRPFGLDVLDRLATACGAVKERLSRELALLQGQIPAWPTLPTDTLAARFLPTITALTTREAVDRAASMSEQEEAELKRLEEVLATARAEDPAKRSKELLLRRTRVTQLIGELGLVRSVLDAENVRDLVDARRAATETERRAQEFASEFKADVSLPGFGSAAWRRLWDSAAHYSTTTAYPGQQFPHVAEGAVCVLCQQELQDAGKQRLSGFAAFVLNRAQQEARAAAERFAEKRARVEALVPTNVHRGTREEIAAYDAGLASEVEAFLTAAQECRGRLLADGSDHLGVAAPISRLERANQELEMRAAELQRAADPEARRAAERRYTELVAKRTLSGIRGAIDAEIARLGRINAYERCLRDTDTRAITVLSTDLTTRYVTNVLTEAFDQELMGLGFRSPELALRAVGGQRGNLYHQVQLKHATRAVLSKVVSEGEARCVALAAFLAELRSAGDTSGIVFDDPVSSLDNRWRTSVAERLVEESKVRQVIVFTHEMVFVFALLQAAERKGIRCQTQTVLRGPGGAGHVDIELPWAVLSTQKRLKWIKNELQAVEKVFRTEGPDAYEPRATRLYARLRQTWERGVEDLLVGGVVERFRPSIETKRLDKLCDIRQTDVDAIIAGMTKCSRWEGGHDHARAAAEPVPGPEELHKDVEALDNWVKDIQARRQ